MKKIAIALVIVACLLTGALLPALAETDLSRPAAAEEPRMEEKTPGETELPAREETPKATDGREDPAASEAEPAAPKATRAPKATDGREDPATPEEKPDAFEAPEPSQRHGHHGAAHPHGKRHHGGERLRARSGRRHAAPSRSRRAATAGGPALPPVVRAGAEPAPLRRLSVWPRMSRLGKRPAHRNAAGPASGAGIPPGRGTRKEDDASVGTRNGRLNLKAEGKTPLRFFAPVTGL